jgi:trimethylamine--corrinoid protein Co-methyltransferase
VEKCLKVAPTSWKCGGRDESFDYIMGPDAHLTGRTSGGPIKRYRPETGKIAMVTDADCAEYARVTDALPHINTVGTITPSDLPLATYDIHTLRTFLKNSRKHLWCLTVDSKNLAYELEMMVAVAGSEAELRKRPLASGLVCVIEPLYIPHDEIERLLLYGKYNIPLRVPFTPVSGANAPYTFAGILNLMNAEFLGSQVVLQTLCPGIPHLYYTAPQTMDMRTGGTHYINPDAYPVQAAFKQLGDMYGVPVSQSLAATGATQYPQYIFDRAAGLMWAASLGIQEIGPFGAVDSVNTIIPLTLVLDNEMLSFAKFSSKGMEINDETLAADAINRVGPRGHFMADKHTLEFLRKEDKFQSDIFDWRGFDAWSSDYKDIIDHAQEKLNHILKYHDVPPLDDAVLKELDAIVAAADKELL